MRGALWFMLCGAILGFAMTLVLEASYKARAQKVQPVRIDRTKKSIFGPVTSEVGEPVMMILDDPAVFLKNKTATGLPQVDVDALQSHGGEGLQMKTIQSAVGLARIGCLLSCALAAAGLVLLNRIGSPLTPPETPQL